MSTAKHDKYRLLYIIIESQALKQILTAAIGALHSLPLFF
jgi:hypothetical protein